MNTKILTVEQAADLIENGSTIMVGGFLGFGCANNILEEVNQRPLAELTIISNDTAFPGKGIGKLIDKKQIAKLLVTHIGTNPETGKQMSAGEIDVELIPQGTMAERIRCGGYGLGGVLTPTGIGTPVEEGKKVIEVEGKKFLLELPLNADIALIKAYKADKTGNLIYQRVGRNFNPLMASAGKIVIAEVEKIVETGEIDPDEVVTPSVFVDYLVEVGEEE